jgi:hypothetical protein
VPIIVARRGLHPSPGRWFTQLVHPPPPVTRDLRPLRRAFGRFRPSSKRGDPGRRWGSAQAPTGLASSWTLLARLSTARLGELRWRVPREAVMGLDTWPLPAPAGFFIGVGSPSRELCSRAEKANGPVSNPGRPEMGCGDACGLPSAHRAATPGELVSPYAICRRRGAEYDLSPARGNFAKPSY